MVAVAPADVVGEGGSEGGIVQRYCFPRHIDGDARVTNVHDSAKRHRKSLPLAYGLWMCFGFMGAHHFYLERPVHGSVTVLTFGGFFGSGWVVDFFCSRRTSVRRTGESARR